MKRQTFDLHWNIWCSIWSSGDRQPEAYWFALQRIPDEVFALKSKGCVQTCEYFPTPARLYAQEISLPGGQRSGKFEPVAPEPVSLQDLEKAEVAIRRWLPRLADRLKVQIKERRQREQT